MGKVLLVTIPPGEGAAVADPCVPHDGSLTINIALNEKGEGANATGR